LSSFVLSNHGAFRKRVRFQITPQINHQSPSHRHYPDPPHAGASCPESWSRIIMSGAARRGILALPMADIASGATAGVDV